MTDHLKRVESFAEKTEDFSEVLEGVEDVPMSLAVQELLIHSEKGPELMYHLAQDRDEFARICELSPLEAARELGKLEFQFFSSAKESKGNKKARVQSNAPRPIEPLNGSWGSTGAKDLEKLSYKDFKAEREAEIYGKGD